MRNAKPIDNGPSRITALTLEGYRRQAAPQLPEPGRGTREHYTPPPVRDWRDEAACRPELYPEPITHLFYPPEHIGGGNHLSWWTEAKAVCAQCQVKAECLQDALTEAEYTDYGVRGGYTAQERRALRSELRRERRYLCDLCSYMFTASVNAWNVTTCPDCRPERDRIRRLDVDGRYQQRVAREICSVGPENGSAGTGSAEQSPSDPQGTTGTLAP